MKPRLKIRFPLRQQWKYCFGRPYSPADNEFLLNHARSGILLALQALDLPAGSQVGVMAYNCHTVFNAVAQAGLQPLFLDVTDQLTLDLDDLRKKRASLRALVVSHLFGIPSDVGAIRQEFPDLPVIEDCAHAFGMKSLEGDFCVFSIGQGKLPSLGDGGILRINNETYLPAVQDLYRRLPDYSRLQSCRQFCTMAIKSVLNSPMVYPWLTRPLKARRRVPSGVEAIAPSKMSRGVSALYETAMHSMPEVIERRLLNARSMEELLTGLSGVKYVLPGSINGFMAVAFCDEREVVRDALLRHGIEAETHFAHCIDWAKAFGYVEGSCPHTEELICHLLMAPTY